MVNNDATLLDWNSGWAVALCLVLICGVILLWIFLLVRLLTQAAPAPGAAPRGRRAATTTLGRTLSRANLAGEDMFRAVRGVRRRSADRASATARVVARRVEASRVERAPSLADPHAPGPKVMYLGTGPSTPSPLIARSRRRAPTPGRGAGGGSTSTSSPSIYPQTAASTSAATWSRGKSLEAPQPLSEEIEDGSGEVAR